VPPPLADARAPPAAAAGADARFPPAAAAALMRAHRPATVAAAARMRAGRRWEVRGPPPSCAQSRLARAPAATVLLGAWDWDLFG